MEYAYSIFHFTCAPRFKVVLRSKRMFPDGYFYRYVRKHVFPFLPVFENYGFNLRKIKNDHSCALYLKFRTALGTLYYHFIALVIYFLISPYVQKFNNLKCFLAKSLFLLLRLIFYFKLPYIKFYWSIKNYLKHQFLF